MSGKKTGKRKKIASISRNFFREDLGAIVSILFIVASIAVDFIAAIYPEMISFGPRADDMWTMFEAQVGISAVGLTIVSLIISIVNTEAYGMSLPKFIMETSHRRFFRYQFILAFIILLVIANWIFLLEGFAFTASCLFILTGFLALYLTYSAMNIIYTKDSVRQNVRKYIINKYDLSNRPAALPDDYFEDLDNIYKAMARNIVNGETPEFLENLKLAKELLSFEIICFDKHGKSFAKNIGNIVNSAVDADIGKISISILKFYYDALIAAKNYRIVGIYSLCINDITALIRILDFDYFDNYRDDKAFSYHAFLRILHSSQEVNRASEEEAKQFNELKENPDLLRYYSFQATQYYALYKNKHENSIKPENYNSLFQCFTCDNEYINHNVYGEMALCDMVFAYPKKAAFDSLLDLDYDIENENEIFEQSVEMSIDYAQVSDLESVSIYIYKCLLLYSQYDDIYANDFAKELCVEYLDKHYARFYRRFCEELDNSAKHQTTTITVLKNIYDTLSNYRSYSNLCKVSEISRGIFEKFVLYTAILKSKTPQTALDALKGIFKEEFVDEIYSWFYPSTDRFGIRRRAVFNEASYIKFLTCYKLINDKNKNALCSIFGGLAKLIDAEMQCSNAV
jgi:hypothetical protein